MTASGPCIQQAKSAPQEADIFTNCGKAENQETPVKPAKKKLTRVPFTVSRLMEFCTRRELVNQTGHDVSEWPLVVLKELIDNSLDAAEEAEIAPVVSITVKRQHDHHHGQRPGHSGEDDRRRPRLQHPGVVTRGLRVADAGCAGQRAQDHPADGLCAGRAPRRRGFRQDHHRGARDRAPHRVRGRSHPARAEDRAHHEAVDRWCGARGSRSSCRHANSGSYEIDIVEHCKESFLGLAEILCVAQSAPEPSGVMGTAK